MELVSRISYTVVPDPSVYLPSVRLLYPSFEGIRVGLTSVWISRVPLLQLVFVVSETEYEALAPDISTVLLPETNEPFVTANVLETVISSCKVHSPPLPVKLIL